MKLENFDLKDHMIHQPPMLLVDKILEESPSKAKTSFTVNENCIFLDENNVLARSALVEIAAQSFAAADIYQRTVSGKSFSKGFLVSVRDFKFLKDVISGDEIICRVERTNEIAGLHVIETKLFVADMCVAEGELRIFELPENPSSAQPQ